ncbi:MAG: hypothetical protein ACI38R_22695 [Rhodococcus sp. (in: high G+C Gram-positive bacteria)]
MTDFLIVYGAIALLLTIGGGGGWLGHLVVRALLRRREQRTKWQEYLVHDEDKSREFLRRWLGSRPSSQLLHRVQMPDGSVVQERWTAAGVVSVPEVPPRETNPHPTPPAPSTTKRLRLWTFDSSFIEELPLDVRLHDEGFIRLPIGSSAQRRINEAFDNDELVWLTVNGARGQWIGYCVRTHWSSERPGFCDFEFQPEPKRSTVWASWSGLCQCPRHADPNHPACQQSYPQA